VAHSIPQKISSKFVYDFLSNLADRQTDRERDPKTFGRGHNQLST